MRALTSRFSRLRESDRLIAILLGIATLALYVRTLLPHVGGTEDTPKFQYLGKVLGTAHNPGYPLYVMVSHLFSYLPIGTLAYRINLMSAVFGVVTMVLAFFVMRRLRIHRAIAVAAALLLAGGRFFWSNAVLAEVYSLNTVLWSAAILKLIDWRESGRDRDLYWATAFVALDLGHHLTILGIFPAAFLFLVMSGRRWLRPRVLLTCALILIGGVAQYLFIVIRTRMGGLYVESPANNLRELLDVMTARTYSHAMFGMDFRTFIEWRLPDVWWFTHTEMRWGGLITAAIGLAWLIVRNPPVGVLLGAGAGAVWFLTASYTIADNTGFLLPTFATLWVLSGAGLEYLRRLAAERIGRAAGVAVVVVALAFAAGHVADNRRFSDRHGQTLHSDYFSAVFEQLPPSSGLIIDDYWPEQMLHYGLVSGDFKREGEALRLLRSDPQRVRQELAEGHPVYAFPGPAAVLRAQGFQLEPVELQGKTLKEYLDGIRNGRLIAVAANVSSLPVEFSRRFRGTVVRAPGRPALVAAGVVTSRRNANASLAVQRPDRVWMAGEIIEGTDVRSPVTIHAAIQEDGSPTIRVADRPISAQRDDVLVVVMHRDGQVEEARSFSARLQFRDHLEVGGWPLARVVRPGTCREIADGKWHDVTNLSGGGAFYGRIDNYRPFDSSMTLYLASAWPLNPELGEISRGCQVPAPCPKIAEPELAVTHYRVDRPDRREELARDAQADGLSVAWPAGVRYVSRAHITVNDQGQYVSFLTRSGGVPIAAWGRASTDMPDAAHRATVCAPPPTGLFEDGQTTWVFDPADVRVINLSRGWTRTEWGGASWIRWTTEPAAVLTVPMVRIGTVRLQLEGHGPAGEDQASLSIGVNGTKTEPRVLTGELRKYEWTIPASAWREGLNYVTVEVSGLEPPASGGVFRGVGVHKMQFDLVQ